MWPHGNLLGWTQFCKQTGHSIFSYSVADDEKNIEYTNTNKESYINI